LIDEFMYSLRLFAVKSSTRVHHVAHHQMIAHRTPRLAESDDFGALPAYDNAELCA
jgi:hypothetical protein